MILSSPLVFCFLAYYALEVLAFPTTVTLNYGSFNGLQDAARGYVAFRGVRYANNPTGNNRWREPVFPPTVQLGSVNATQFGKSCISGGSTSVPAGESEDCLFGNIYVPQSATVTDRLPVMVWYHGGGLQNGNGQVTAEYLLKTSTKPMIFVAFNYRLAQFGFLGGTAINSNGSLNAGLLDQYASLKWVNKYISNFGGDPARVTISGQSAGAASVMFQLIGHRGNNSGLFHQAIGESPSLSFTAKFNSAYVEGIFSEFASNAGCGNATDKLACLRAAPVNTLAAAGPQTTSTRKSTIYVFLPVVGGTFLYDAPIAALAAGRFPRIPWIFGSNTNEGVGWSAGVADPAANPATAGATQINVFNFLKGQYNQMDRATFDQMVALYPLSQYGNSFVSQTAQMYGEVRYICTAGILAGAAQSYGGLSSYHYRYNNPGTGSGHSAELAAFFSSTPEGSANYDLFLQMRQYWTSFVTSGKPISGAGITWEAVSDGTGQRNLLLQPGSIQMQRMNDAMIKRCQKWHDLAATFGT